MVGKRLCRSLFIYWLILVIWQNIGDYVGNSNFALFIKLALVLFLVIKFCSHTIAINSSKLVLWFVFAAYMIAELVIYGADSSSTIIYYIFPVILTFLTYICQGNAEVDEESYFNFLKGVIVVVLYMAAYSLIFQTAYFANIFHLTSTYGNELTSFLISSHEYGMYLVFGIISCALCFIKAEKPKTRTLYVVIIIVFSFNLLATLSRTSMLALVAFGLTFFLLSGKNRVKKYIAIAAAIFLMAYIFVPEFRSFLFTIIFKENNDAGRVVMWDASFEYFKNEDFIHQLFGMGNSSMTYYVNTVFGHGSIHNAFLQVLMVLGIFGELWLVGCVICSFIRGIRIRKINRNYGALFTALTVAAISFMFTNTACIMESPIDSFMLTIFTITVPYYVSNGIYQNDSNYMYGGENKC